MNLRNVNYAKDDSSYIMQNSDIKLTSATLSENISIQKKNQQIAILFTEHIIIVSKNVWYSFWFIIYFYKRPIDDWKECELIKCNIQFLHIFLFIKK